MLLRAVTALMLTVGTAAFADSEGDPKKVCREQLNKMPGPFESADVAKVCDRVAVIDACKSARGVPIYHFDALSKKADARKVLVMSLIHGDENESGSVARQWMTRLTSIESRSSWRIVPVLNPDGWERNQRTNFNGVDLNRNFPSRDWHAHALPHWEKSQRKDPRRYPGPNPASEPETLCAMKMIEEYQPDFIISVHTPYGVLDFDGPSVAFPRFGPIPWVSLGTFPGSLGRYMWMDRKTPVLTIELKDGRLLEQADKVDFLQDIAGTVALRAKAKLYKEARQ